MPCTEVSTARLAKGLCVNCGKNPHLSGLKYCEPCRTKASARNKAYKNDLKTAGLCAMGCKRSASSGRIYCGECGAKIAASQRRIDEQRLAAGLCTECVGPLDRQGRRCTVCVAKVAATAQARKDRVFSHYGGYECACCHETMIECLQIDHVNNDGASHRLSIGGPSMTGDRFYRWLIDNQFPAGFQVLCANCNLGKLRNKGICPHRITPQLPQAEIDLLIEPVPQIESLGVPPGNLQV